MKNIFKSRSTVRLDKNVLIQNGLSFNDVKMYLPDFVLNSFITECNGWQKFLYSLICKISEILIYIFLRPRSKKTVDKLDIKEVEWIYDNEAKSYDWKHHLTTCGMDTSWRRLCGWIAAITRRNIQNDHIDILDLCTGTGLTIAEMTPILKSWGITSNIVGLDYDIQMLKIARKKLHLNPNVNFVRGDAMNLTEYTDGNLVCFTNNSFDLITQIFGMGGIDRPNRVFDGVLKILRQGGIFLMVDIHQPIPITSKEWFFIRKWYKSAYFEQFAYHKVTIPLALNQLWGWRDTTLLFYLLPLVTWNDRDNNWWGFETVFFEQESLRWWFSLPTMPVAKIIVKKVLLDKKEAQKRRTILAAIIPCSKSMRDYYFLKNMVL